MRRVPLPVFALAVGLAVGAAAWLVIDRLQTRALSDIFDQTLASQLEQLARESLIRFDEHRDSFEYLARLLANHRRMAAYLEPLVWNDKESIELREYHLEQPLWLPRGRIWRDIAQPSHLILADRAGGLREVYSLSGEPLPPSLLEDPPLYLEASRQRAFLSIMDKQPYLLVSEPIEDSFYYPMGSLVILVPIDGAFLAASQQSVQSAQSIAALVDPDAQLIVSSSDPLLIEVDTSVEELEQDYLVTARSFFDYADSDLNLLFATVMPRSAFRETVQAVIDLERSQRAMGAAGIVVAFVLVFVLLSSRINRLLLRLQEFSRRALGERGETPTSGNQLLMLEERIREVIELVLRAREETRTRHETKVQQLENLRAGVMEASVDSIVTIDAKGKVIDFNPTAQATFGRTLEDVRGLALADFVFDAASASRFKELLHHCLTDPDCEEAPLRHELTAIGPDERPLLVEVAIKPVLLEQELLFTVYIHDIAERKARETEIRALAAFPEESPSPVLRINARGVITYANAPSFALLDYWKCRPMQTLPVYWRDQVTAVLRTGSNREMEISTESGIYSLLMTPVQDLGYVNIYARDVTEQRRMEDALQQRQDELVHVARLSTMGEMSTGIAHELNQPLSAIANFANGCARRLRLDIGGKEELLTALSQISAQADRAAEIIKRLRSLVTRQHVVRSQVDLNHLILEVCEVLAHDLRKNEIAMERRLFPGELHVRVDAVQIEQAVLNLMRNALDSMSDRPPPERRLAITSGMQEDGMVYVSVQDNGNGIRPADMEHLFDAFFTTKETGMGMGLAITQTIVEEHRGRIHADSWPGKGSTFTIELPASIESAESLAS
jgi:PAS domain S-box-containing protein